MADIPKAGMDRPERDYLELDGELPEEQRHRAEAKILAVLGLLMAVAIGAVTLVSGWQDGASLAGGLAVWLAMNWMGAPTGAPVAAGLGTSLTLGSLLGAAFFDRLVAGLVG